VKTYWGSVGKAPLPGAGFDSVAKTKKSLPYSCPESELGRPARSLITILTANAVQSMLADLHKSQGNSLRNIPNLVSSNLQFMYFPQSKKALLTPAEETGKTVFHPDLRRFGK
jgi:hypothetical protein